MNLISCALCGGFYIHRRMIVDKQEYVPVSRVSEVLGDPVEETLIENDTPSTTLLKRNINSTVSASNVSEL